MKAQTITIIGMGRIGASIGLALKQSGLKVTIVGHDREAALAREAKEKVGAIDKAAWNLINASSAADILVLTMPVTELEEILRAIGQDLQPHTLVLDLSNCKVAGLKWAEQYLQRGHYVGGVPVLAAASLADGRDELEAASADLFKNSVFCLMPAAKADPQAVDTAVNFGLLLGATPYFVDPAEYDTLVQAVETIPGLLAAVMFSTVHKATGWRDMLRFASFPFAQTTLPVRAGGDIAYLALNNKMATLRWLDALLEELREVRRWVHEGEEEVLTAMIEGMSVERARWLKDRAENNWVEMKAPEVDMPTMGEQLLGRWGRRRGAEE